MIASYFTSLEDNKVQCHLCPHECILANTRRGKCRIRINHEGTLYSDSYGILSAMNIDPIEKKPLYHFHPGRMIYSIGGYGCNFSCPCCQNYEISQTGSREHITTEKHTPVKIVEEALTIGNNIGVAYTYNEPLIEYEFVRDTAEAIKGHALKNVVVSNGFINSGPLSDLIPLIDAFNIDLKAFQPALHKKFTGGELRVVLETLRSIRKAGKHLEITSLIVPGLNDSLEKFEAMLKWIKQELGDDVPFHISRYFPRYKMLKTATDGKLLLELAALSSTYLEYVYLGNVGDNHYSHTWCKQCGELLIVRNGYSVKTSGVNNNGCCRKCGLKVVLTDWG